MVRKAETIDEHDRVDCSNDNTPINNIVFGKDLPDGCEYKLLKTAYRKLELKIHLHCVPNISKTTTPIRVISACALIVYVLN